MVLLDYLRVLWRLWPWRLSWKCRRRKRPRRRRRSKGPSRVASIPSDLASVQKQWKRHKGPFPKLKWRKWPCIGSLLERFMNTSLQLRSIREIFVHPLRITIHENPMTSEYPKNDDEQRHGKRHNFWRSKTTTTSKRDLVSCKGKIFKSVTWIANEISHGKAVSEVDIPVVFRG